MVRGYCIILIFVRNVVDSLLEWHREIRSPGLMEKLDRISQSPFRLFRGTYFLFVRDLRNTATMRDAGLVVGDIHGENFGTYRSITGEIVYDIDDFDEASMGLYEHDVLRLALSVALAGTERGQRFGEALVGAEIVIRHWLDCLASWKNWDRAAFEKLETARPVRKLLANAREKSRQQFLRGFVRQTGDTFGFEQTAEYRPAPQRLKEVRRAIPLFAGHCLAPKNANLRHFQLLDVAERTAGTGSLGRDRLALLFDKGDSEQPDWRTLRLIEWKESWVSSIDSPLPKPSRGRAEEVWRYLKTLQLFPKRYTGFTRIAAMGMQAREIGSNDRRFRFEEGVKGFALLAKAAPVQAGILARAHLLGAQKIEGPRGIPLRMAGGADRYVMRMLRLVAGLLDQAHEDYAVLLRERSRLESKWKKQSRPQ